LQVLKEEEAFVADAFNIECVGKIYSNDLRQYLTSDKGILKGNWANFPLPFIANFDIPNAVLKPFDCRPSFLHLVYKFSFGSLKTLLTLQIGY
jgi:hypothetical protein